MTQWDVLAAFIDKFGLPGVVLLVLAWAIYRFGATPSQPMASAETPTSAALEKLSGKIDAMKEEMIDRLARVETNVENLKQARGR